MIRANYDRHADVLYVALDQPRGAVSEEGGQGLIYRFSLDKAQPCGVTVISCKAIWRGKERELAGKIAAFLRTDTNEVQGAIVREIA